MYYNNNNMEKYVNTEKLDNVTKECKQILY